MLLIVSLYVVISTKRSAWRNLIILFSNSLRPLRYGRGDYILLIVSLYVVISTNVEKSHPFNLAAYLKYLTPLSKSFIS